MSSAARIPGADLRTPSWPTRPGAASGGGAERRDAAPETPVDGRPRVSVEQHPGLRPVAAVGASGSEGPTASPVPPEEQALDPRSIARASLAAGRNRSLWWTLGGIAAAVGTAFAWDAVVGVLVLAALLVVYGVVRAVGAPPGPAAVVVRSKALDVTVLLGCAATLVALAAVLPGA